jgi:flagellar hook-basal body complex protein FliE
MIESITGVGSATAATGVASTAGAAGTAAAGGPSFSDVFAEVVGNAVGTMKAGEAAAISGISGDMSVQQAVSAIMSAEQTLQTALAVRDKVVAAYQEISRMAI